MQRDRALEIVRDNLKAENLICHSLATEAVMAELAKRLGEDEAQWALCGLLHDIDYEQTAECPERHGLVSVEMLKNEGVDDAICHAIAAHNEANGTAIESTMDKAIYCADPVTGFITACALVRPDKVLETVKVKSLKKKFKDKAFARGADRAQMDACSELGLERAEFLEIALEAMKSIAKDLGL